MFDASSRSTVARTACCQSEAPANSVRFPCRDSGLFGMSAPRESAEHGVIDVVERREILTKWLLKPDARLIPGQSSRLKPGNGRSGTMTARSKARSRASASCRCGGPSTGRQNFQAELHPLRRSGGASGNPCLLRKMAIGRQIFRERRFSQRAKAIVRPYRCVPRRELQASGGSR